MDNVVPFRDKSNQSQVESIVAFSVILPVSQNAGAVRPNAPLCHLEPCAELDSVLFQDL